MSWGRLIGASAAFAAVVGCTAVAVAMSRTQPSPDAVATTLPSMSASYPRYAAALPAYPSSTSAAASSAKATATASPTPKPRTTRPASTHHAAAPAPAPSTTSRSTSPAPRPAPQRGGALPLGFSTGNATRVITVTASSYGSTTAWLQPWVKAPGGGWLRYGSGVTAHVGSDGLSKTPSEFRSYTPIGSFTLTQAFGALSNPGTPLPYTQTNGSYWWISQNTSLYNTMQSCWSNCPFTQGSPNEHLYYETPYYNYAVVIDYNRWPAVYPDGSAFFLHVTDGNPTAGCVAIPQWRLVQIMQWLTPSAHPRILIGVT